MTKKAPDLVGSLVKGVYGVEKRRLSDGDFSYTRVIVVLSDRVVEISASESDSIRIRMSNNIEMSGECNSQEILKNIYGKELGLSWIGKNVFGFVDLLIISSKSSEPEIAFCAVASRVHIYYLSPISTVE